MSPAGFSVIPLLVFLGLMGPMSVPPLPDTPTLTKIAPEECLFYMSFAGRAEPKADSANQTEQLLAEPEVQKFAANVETVVKTLLERGLQQPGAPPLTSDDITSLAKTLLNRPMAVYVGSVTVQPTGPDIHGGMVVRLGDAATQFKAQLEKITRLLPPQAIVPVQDGKDTWQSFKPEPNVTFVWGVKGEYFMAAVGEGEMQALVKRAFGKPPAWLTDIKKNAGIERISTVGYLNVKSILQIATPHGPPDAAKVFEAVGIANLKNITLVTGLDKTGFVGKTGLNFDGSPRGIFETANAKPLTAADFAPVPADAMAAVVVRLDPGGILDTYLKIVEQADPKAKADMLNALGQMESHFGLSLRDDILQPLGDTVCFFNSVKEGGPMGGTVVIRLKDAQKAKATMEKLLQLVESLGQANPNAPKIQKSDFEGKEIYSLQPPGVPLMPSWCLTDKELVVGMVPDKVKAYLSRKADFKSLADVPDISKRIQDSSGPLCLVYIDTKQVFDGLYASLPMLLAMASPTLHQHGIDFNASMLPSAGSIRGHLLPLVATVRKTPSGIEITERSSLPMSVVMSPANPVAIGLLLPAVQSAREAARRAQSMNNMKQIALAMFNYLDAKKTFPPAYKAGKDGKPLLSWRVLILPYLEEKDLYQQFNLDEPWDSEHNKKLIDKMPAVYKSPNSAKAAAGKTVYLTVRGEKTVFSGGKGTRIADITDGTSNTIMTVEANDEEAVPWTKPDDFEYDANNPLKGLGGMHPSVFLAGFADGSVRAISNSIDPKMLKALFTRNGNEPIDWNQVP